MRSIITSLLAATAVAASVTAQAPVEPRFEVASVKVNTTGSSNSSTRTPPGGTLIATNLTLRQLIVAAYRLRRFQVTGGPGWLDADRFDINARPPENTPPGQWQLMLQTLLADRFALRFHRETREQPVYALVLAREDGKPGPQLKPSTLDCSKPPVPSICGMNTTTNATIGKMTAGGRTMEELAVALANYAAERIVLDRTGLAGRYDFEVQWTPDSARGAQADSGSLFTALQEQLGLKLDAQRGPVEFLIVDAAERPTPD